MKKKLLFAILTVTMLLCGCGRSNTNTPENSSAAESQTGETHSTTQAGENLGVTETNELLNNAETTENHNTTQTDNAYNTAETEGMIGEEEAKRIALTHAGLTTEQVTFIKSGLDRDDGKINYDVEFYEKDGKEYDYEIDPYSGEILDYDHDAEYYGTFNEEAIEGLGNTANSGTDKTSDKTGTTDGQTDTTKTSDKKDTTTNSTDNKTGTTNTGELTADQALKIALDKVPGATSQNIREFKSDYDDGRLEYEGKIYYENVEYEFEIDGETGKILEWDVEPIYGAVS